MPYREPGDQPLKILFADDSNTMRKVAEITFASDGYDLVLLSRGADIVESVKKNQPRVVILDAEMPEMDGYEACWRLRQDAATSGIPVLLLSGPSNPFDERRARDVGVTDHMDKPFETQSIYDKLELLAAAPPGQPSLGAPSAASKPAAEQAPAARPKVGSKTVLGLGAMGYAPKPAPSQKPPVASVGTRPKQAPPAGGKAGPIVAPVAAKPAQKPAPIKAPPIPLDEPVAPPLAEKPAALAAPVLPSSQSALCGIVVPGDLDKPAAQRAAEFTPEQLEAIKAVAREVIERVVWEVVPDLAETIIKEQLAKLLND